MCVENKHVTQLGYLKHFTGYLFALFNIASLFHLFSSFCRLLTAGFCTYVCVLMPAADFAPLGSLLLYKIIVKQAMHELRNQSCHRKVSHRQIQLKQS